MKKVSCIYFSGTGKTKAIVEEIANHISEGHKSYDLLRKPLNEKVILDSDIVVVGMPVYAGRIPERYAEMLENFKGNKTPVIAVVTYGNREYEDALLELVTILQKNDCVVIGAGAFVAQHSIFPVVGEGRPNQKDFSTIKQFTQRCMELFNEERENLKSIKVKGNFPYRETGSVPLKPTGDRKCNKCGRCSALCPVGAIDKEKPTRTDKTKCMCCGACILICPEKSRNYHGLLYLLAQRKFKSNYSEEKQPELFFIG